MDLAGPDEEVDPAQDGAASVVVLDPLEADLAVLGEDSVPARARDVEAETEAVRRERSEADGPVASRPPAVVARIDLAASRAAPISGSSRTNSTPLPTSFTPCTASPTPAFPNVEGLLSLGDSVQAAEIRIRIAFYDTNQCTPEGQIVDTDDYTMAFYPNPPFEFPFTFYIFVPVGETYVAEAWQDVNENSLIDDGDLVGDSGLFTPGGENMASIAITLEYYSAP
jgi:hypothetical protein